MMKQAKKAQIHKKCTKHQTEFNNFNKQFQTMKKRKKMQKSINYKPYIIKTISSICNIFCRVIISQEINQMHFAHDHKINIKSQISNQLFMLSS